MSDQPDTDANSAWTSYWQGGPLHSCVAGADPLDAEELAAWWAAWAAGLPTGARVLDLATGNGAVPAMLLRARPDLQLTGVDRADIRPAAHLDQPAQLTSVQFHGGVDLNRWLGSDASPGSGVPLPGGRQTFAAVTSQFGIEYAGVDALVPIAQAALSAGGQLCCLLHHSNSAVVAGGRHDLDELTALLGADGPGDALAELAATGQGGAALEAATHAFLAKPIRHTRRLSGAVAARIDTLLTQAEQDPATGREQAADLLLRLLREQERLNQLAAAALDQRAATALAAALTAGGLRARLAPMQLGEARGAPALLGWQLLAEAQSP